MKRYTILAVLFGFLLPQSLHAAESPKIETDIVYGHKDGLAMTMDRYHPQTPNGAAVLFMVSGGWRSKWAPPEELLFLFQPFLSQGYNVFAVRHGSSPRYTIPEAMADVRRAVRFVRYNAERFEIDDSRLGVLGMSAGGHLSLMLGTTGDDGNPEGKDDIERTSSRVAAVVALVPPTDLRVAVWEAPESLPAYRGFPALDLPLDKAKEYSPVIHVTPDDAPSLVIMGGKDDLVPPEHGEWIDEQFEKKNVARKLIIFPEAGHDLGGITTRLKTFQESIDWYNTHLAKEAESTSAP